MVYKIAKNLTYQIDADYFKPGDFYQDTLDSMAKDAYGSDYGVSHGHDHIVSQM